MAWEEAVAVASAGSFCCTSFASARMGGEKLLLTVANDCCGLGWAGLGGRVHKGGHSLQRMFHVQFDAPALTRLSWVCLPELSIWLPWQRVFFAQPSYSRHH